MECAERKIKRPYDLYALRWRVFRRDGFRCRYCGRGPGDNMQITLDHITPLSQGGTYDEENLVTACYRCNQGKRDTMLSQAELALVKVKKEC